VRHGERGRRGPLVCAPWRAGERLGARRGAAGAWGLNYKYKIEEELKAYEGEGLGGAVVVYPFAGGFVSGILGELAFGSLELPPFSDLPSTLFWGGFAWIYVMQVMQAQACSHTCTPEHRYGENTLT
jgi:hypothetical protein